MRRREAVLARKLEAKISEIHRFRQREACAYALNLRLRHELETAAERQGSGRAALQELRAQHAAVSVRNDELQTALDAALCEVHTLRESLRAAREQHALREQRHQEEVAFYRQLAQRAMHDLGRIA